MSRQSLTHCGWIACLYFFQSLPYMVVATMAALCYQHYGLGNATATLLTSLFMLPWCIKPVFAPILEKQPNKKTSLLIIQGGLVSVVFLLALTTNSSFFLPLSIPAFLVLALLSSMNDILSDGLYLSHLSEREQKRYVGLRSGFYQLGRLTVKGGLLTLAVFLASRTTYPVWPLFFSLLTLLLVVFVLFHALFIPNAHKPSSVPQENYLGIQALFLQKKWHSPLFFIFIYNLTDAQIQKMLPLYLVDPQGMGLSLPQFGALYGVFGSLALISGISFAGYLSGRLGTASCLKKLTFLMVPGHLCFFLMTQVHGYPLLWGFVLLGQLIAGLLNGAYMTYLLRIANQSPYPMSMYTLCTSIMALSYIVFGALSGFIQHLLGYPGFFLAMLSASSFPLLNTCKMLRQPLLMSPDQSANACDNPVNFC
ncbi:MFS transporter [Legionella taurinensis]|nr:MFS transporter [Legionella taurinensis]MDX1838786.1 MFS transporter [Legionella taurinensis]TID48034.1 MFS transporter [Legionella taurinensis]